MTAQDAHEETELFTVQTKVTATVEALDKHGAVEKARDLGLLPRPEDHESAVQETEVLE